MIEELTDEQAAEEERKIKEAAEAKAKAQEE